MKKVIIETIGIETPHLIVRGYKDGVLVYQFEWDFLSEAIQAAQNFLKR